MLISLLMALSIRKSLQLSGCSNANLARLFERHIWRETKFDGAQEDRPRFLYNLEGKRQEFDPRVSFPFDINLPLGLRNI